VRNPPQADDEAIFSLATRPDAAIVGEESLFPILLCRKESRNLFLNRFLHFASLGDASVEMTLDLFYRSFRFSISDSARQATSPPHRWRTSGGQVSISNCERGLLCLIFCYANYKKYMCLIVTPYFTIAVFLTYDLRGCHAEPFASLEGKLREASGQQMRFYLC